MVRTPCYDQNGMKKGVWSKEEDEKLRTYIQRYGQWNWRQLPKFAGLSRCGKSCRLRWMNYLKPNVIRGNYTMEEDEMILKLHKEFGTKWCVIASRLPGRTDSDIKNHWHTSLKKRVTSSTIPSAETEQSKKQFKCPSDKAKGKLKQSAGSSVTSGYATFAEEEIQESSFVTQGASRNEFPTSVSSTADFLEITTPTSVLGYPSESAYEDLWADPFLLDNIYFQHGYTPIWAEGEFSSPFEMY